MLLLLIACAPDGADPKPNTPPATTEPTGTATSTPPLEGFYLDCAAGDDAADGRSPDTAWASLTRLAAEPLRPGDTVRFRADGTCQGTLTLNGSGLQDAPITVTTYGDGAPPRVQSTGEAAVWLSDQSWITIEGLEITGSTRWGVYVSADTLVEGINLRDLEVHGVYGDPVDAKGTGLVVFSILSAAGWFEDVLVERVTAYDTDQWSGIYLYGTAWREGGPRSRGVTFQNNIVHHVHGDGIVAFGAEDALLDANLVYEVGRAPDDRVGTPNGVWTWDCHRCTVQFNEAYAVHSPGVDGGAFDIDWDNIDNVVQYNYGHDNDAYCVAVFAAENSTTSGSVVRYNVCVNNSQAPDMAYMGDIFLYTWNGGTLGDVQIYHNTVVRSASYPALVVWSPPGAGSGIWNNLFVVGSEWAATVAGQPEMGNNVWWRAEAGPLWFDDRAEGWYDGVSAWEASGAESGSLQIDPMLSGGTGKEAVRLNSGSPAVDAARVLLAPGACDAFGGRLSGAPDIGAHETGAVADTTCSR